MSQLHAPTGSVGHSQIGVTHYGSLLRRATVERQVLKPIEVPDNSTLQTGRYGLFSAGGMSSALLCSPYGLLDAITANQLLERTNQRA